MTKVEAGSASRPRLIGARLSEAGGDAPASHPPEDGGGAPASHPREDGGEAPASDRPEVSELGIDIIKVDRIRRTLERFGPRFSARVLTRGEQRYVRDRPETLAGRWAAKEAVSKVLGLGVRGIGWRDIEVERLPTGQPAIRLHGRAAARAVQLGMERIAVSISHEADYAVAIAFGVRTAGGRFLFPPDIEERLDERERRILARLERLRSMTVATELEPTPDTSGSHEPSRA